MPEVVHRSPRLRPPAPARSAFDVPSPPAVEPPAKLQSVQLLLPMLGSLSILVYGVMAGTPVLLVTGAIMALASLASPILLHRSAKRAQWSKNEARRARYRTRLGELASALAQAKAEMAAVMTDPHPRPGGYRAWLDAGRLWERRSADDDRLDVRLGSGEVPTGFTVTRSSASSESEPDDDLVALADAFEKSVNILEKAPLVLSLAENDVVAFRGDRTAVLGLVRAVLLELAVTCAPEDLCLLAAFRPGDAASWDWLKWSPHTAPCVDAARERSERLLATSGQGFEEILSAVIAPRLGALEVAARQRSRPTGRHVVVVVDRYDPHHELAIAESLQLTLTHAGEIGVSVLALCDLDSSAPTQTSTLVTMAHADPRQAEAAPAVLQRLRPSAASIPFTPQFVDGREAEHIARLLAPKRLTAETGRALPLGDLRLADLLSAPLLPALPVSPGPVGHRPERWPSLGPARMLRVPFGVTPDGSPVELDLKEPADGGHGPHGLVIGAVGSGKSELLRTVVAGLVATHAPDDVELAFVDFKGGLTFALLQDAPHCSGMITNLASDLTLVDRMKAALGGELERRQRQLRAAGTDVQKIGQYRGLRRDRPDLPPMPFLVLVVDEFGELLEARPDMLDVLLSIGRTGRSLGVHLVLASQRLEPGRNRGLDAYLGYRICLRTYTPEDSVSVLGSRAAADLPALPGHGYLYTGAGLVRFAAATVSGNGESRTRQRRVGSFAVSNGRAAPADSAPASAGSPSHDIAPDGHGLDSDLSVLVRETRNAARGACARALWLPPLPRPDGDNALTLGDSRLEASMQPPSVGLPVPVGLLDLPVARQQVPMMLDPVALDGHLLVVGAPHSGKSTALAAYAIQAARLYPASLLQFHVIDLGGGKLAPLGALPNVAAYADGQDPDAVRRSVLQLERLLDDRSQQVRRRGVQSPSNSREPVRQGEASGSRHTVVLLDQLMSFRERFTDLDAAFGRLIVEGPSAGVHVAVTSTRWGEMPAKRLEQISTRIELRLNDPLESLHGRVPAASVPLGVPGRGLVTSGAVVQLASPDDGTSPADLSVAVRAAAAVARERWPNVAAPRLRTLADLTPSEWVDAFHRAAQQGALLLGVRETGLDAVTVAPGAGPLLLCYGDAASGRSRFLARLLAEAESLPEDARPEIYAVDYLGALGQLCAGGRAVIAAYDPSETPDLLAAVTDELALRQAALARSRRHATPAPGFRPLWLLADDYELVHASARPGLVAELANFVPYTGRLGLGLVINQAANGSGARVDPLIRRMLEVGSWHLRFAVESRLELLLTGLRGSPLPPGQAALTRPGTSDTLLAVLPPPVLAAQPGGTGEPGEGTRVSVPDAELRAKIRLVS
jgi:DNA segregation ATPase FtsK/SpoIIIE, S-DNA-T family